METLTIKDALTLLGRYGLPFVMFCVWTYGGWKRYWVWGYQLVDANRRFDEEMVRAERRESSRKSECDELRTILVRALIVQQEAISSASLAVQAGMATQKQKDR